MPLDPEVKEFLLAMEVAQAPSWEEMGPVESREVFLGLGTMFPPSERVAEITDGDLAGVGTRIYRPTSSGRLPVLIYFHGGGWVIGNLDTHDTLCRRLANRAKCAVIAVDYRLAPEHRFPAAFDDCYAVTKYVAEHGEALKIDETRIAIGGDSAGGNLAAAVSLAARDRGGPKIDMQLLIYPAVEMDFKNGSYSEFAEGYGLTRDSMSWFFEQYFGAFDGDLPAYAIPSKAADVSGLPFTHVITAEYDVLRDEGEAFARRLAKEGTSVTAERYEGMIHGFFHFGGLFQRGLDAVDDVAHLLRSRFDS